MILILGGYFPKKAYQEIIENSKVQVQFSANIFQDKLMRGIKNNTSEKLLFLSAPFINSYPNGYKKNKLEEFESDDNVEYVGFNNLFGVRNISRYINLKKKIKKIIPNNEKIDIIVYSPHTPLLFASKFIKKKYENVSVTLLLPDLPCYMDLSNKKRRLYNFLKKIDNCSFEYLKKYIDKYIFLTEQMNTLINRNNKPYIIVDGMLETKSNLISKAKRNYKIITYTGTLNEKFGIKILIDAFMKVSNQNVKLVVCGKGDAETYITTCCELDKRIVYMGLLNSDDSKKLQQESDILVNPRQNTEEYTKYSFPSKNMEYLSTYNPVIAYMLDGVSKEYEKIFFVPENDSIEALTFKIDEVLNLNDHELKKYRKKIKSFIRRKDYKNVTKEILDFIKN